MRPSALALVATALAACTTVGPDYVPPDVSDITPEGWSGSEPEPGDPSAPAVVGDPAAGPAVAPEELADWWRTLDDPLLSELIERAIDQNRDLRAALARLRQVRAARRIAGADFLPRLGAGGGVSYADAGAGADTLYSGGIDAGWELDLFGGLERSVEAAEADLSSAGQGLLDVLVSLTAEVALEYLQVRSLQERLRLSREVEGIQAETLALVESRAEAGLVTQRDVEQARANLSSTRATVPNLEAGLTRGRNALAVLLGRPPGELDAELAADPGALPDVPRSVALDVPAETLRRRPDVRAAERRLAAETARIGVATADLYPRLSLEGSIGVRSATARGLVSDPTGLFDLGPRLSWNLFDFGRTRARIEAQEQVAEEALARYEQAILRALEDVEGAVVDFVQEQRRQAELADALSATIEARAYALDQYRAGLTDFVTVLDADRQLLFLRDEEASSRAAVATDLVRLYKALGGGWSAAGQVAEAEAERASDPDR